MKVKANIPVLTITKFRTIPAGSIIASGEIENSPQGIYMTDSRLGDKMIWVAKKGYANDWCIYIHWAENGIDYALSNGDKVNNDSNIRKLVPCENDVFNSYRY